MNTIDLHSAHITIPHLSQALPRLLHLQSAQIAESFIPTERQQVKGLTYH